MGSLHDQSEWQADWIIQNDSQDWMMSDPTLLNQTDIPNEKFLAQCITSCRADCKHESCTREWLQENGIFGDFVSIEPQKKGETETLGEGVL
jgi:hypothetical protein